MARERACSEISISRLALVVLPGPRAGVADGGVARIVRPPEARELFEAGPVLVAHAGMTARRLGMNPPPRSARIFDALELFAFTRPARFCAPSAAGLALALGLPEPKGAAEQAAALREVCALLLTELAERPTPSREEAMAHAETLARAGWAWGAAAIGALRSQPLGRPWRGAGLDVWRRLAEWEDHAPPGEAGSQPIDPARRRRNAWPNSSPAPASTRRARCRRPSPLRPPSPSSPASGRASRR